MTDVGPLRSVDFADRVRRARATLGPEGTAEVLVITDLNNVRWLTGLSSSNAAAVLSHGDMTLLTDSRYSAQAAAAAAGSGAHVIVGRNVLSEAMSLAVEQGAPRVAIEADALTVSEFSIVQEAASRASIDVVETTGLIQSLRVAKDVSEVAALTTACEISLGALAALVSELQPGMTEIEVARRLEQLIGVFGAEDRAFPSIVAAGPNSAVPHHEPTSRRIEIGDVLKIDFGARFDGYHADCTRTFIVGTEPTERQLEVHAAVAAAADAARSALRVGVEVAELYEVAWAVLDSAGLADRFTHGLGHGVGLEIHEAPLIAKATAGTICDGAVVTIEPGVYLPGEFGVRIEDTCHVTTSETTILTKFPRELARIA